jgi:hypothetical protein
MEHGLVKSKDLGGRATQISYGLSLVEGGDSNGYS